MGTTPTLLAASALRHAPAGCKAALPAVSRHCHADGPARRARPGLPPGTASGPAPAPSASSQDGLLLSPESASASRCRYCLVATARLRNCGPRAALLLIVQLSSKRARRAVRQ